MDPVSPRGLVDLSYCVTLFAVALPMAAACACLFWIALQLGSSVGAAAFAALALGLATPMWAYSTLFWGHALAGACLVFAFACALRLRAVLGSTADVFWGSALGLAAGWATLTEYPSAPASAMVAGLALALVWKDGQRLWRVILGIAAGALPCLIALLAYQRAAFGSVLHPSYAYYPAGAFSWMTHGYLGLTYPRIDVALKLLFALPAWAAVFRAGPPGRPFRFVDPVEAPRDACCRSRSGFDRCVLFSFSRFLFPRGQPVGSTVHGIWRRGCRCCVSDWRHFGITRAKAGESSSGSWPRLASDLR